jgi:hypothetical protein
VIVLGFALAYAGFTGLCLAMERHYEQVFRSRKIPPLRRKLFVWGGWLLLAASLLPVVHALGWALGSVFWFGILNATALPLAMLLCYAPRAALALAAAPVPAGLFLLLGSV